jgi:hypothetical protein
VKPTKIPCDYLAEGKSERAALLFSAICPHLAPGMAYLDIGCGTAPLTSYLDRECPPRLLVGIDLSREAIASCIAEYPHHTWVVVKSDRFALDRPYDCVIHTGVNAPRFCDAEIHERILAGAHARPRCVLLESGDYLDGPSDTHETYEKIRGIYLQAGYGTAEEGSFTVAHFPVPVRTYVVLTKALN